MVVVKVADGMHGIFVKLPCRRWKSGVLRTIWFCCYNDFESRICWCAPNMVEVVTKLDVQKTGAIWPYFFFRIQTTTRKS